MLPHVKRRFCDRDEFHEYAAIQVSKPNFHPKQLNNDLEFQTRKLFSSLKHGPISDLGEHVNIRPLTFKILVGENHPEFKLWSQQDSLEWFQHFMDVLDRKCANEGNPLKFFKELKMGKLGMEGALERNRLPNPKVPSPVPQLQTAITPHLPTVQQIQSFGIFRMLHPSPGQPRRQNSRHQSNSVRQVSVSVFCSARNR